MKLSQNRKLSSKKIGSICKILFFVLSLTTFAVAQKPAPTPTPSPQTPNNRQRIAPPQSSSVPKPPDSTQKVEEDDQVISVNSRLVVVPVSVIDSNGQPVMSLKKENFRLEEEGRAQEIADISSAEQVPLEIVLLIDVSSSVNPLFEFEKDAAARFLQDVMKSNDRATVFLVGDQPVLVQPRDTSEKTANTIRTINPTKNYTAFFDTVSSAIEYLKKNSPEKSRRVILSLSDGEDTYSKNTLTAYEGAYKELDKKINSLTQSQRVEILNRYRLAAQDRNYSKILRELQNADVVFYSVNPAGASLKINQISLRGQQGLQRFADETGGTAFLPKILPNDPAKPLESNGNTKQNAETLENIFRQIAAELRAQYLLQFYSESTFQPGKYVRLKVNLNQQSSFRVRSRQGYFAASQ